MVPRRMGNVLDEQKQHDVRALGRQGWTLRRIAAATGVHRVTAGEYLRAAGIPVRRRGRPREGTAKPTISPPAVSTDLPANPAIVSAGSTDVVPARAPAASACEIYREVITEACARGRNAMAIWQDLVDDHGFTARYASVRRFVRRWRETPSAEARVVITTAPGEEAQVDYGEGPMVRDPATGKYKRTRLFVLTLGYSRKAVRLLVWRSSAQVWAELHEQAFRRLGGVVKVIILDNLKEGVLTPDVYDPALNPLYRDVLAHYGVVALPCRVRKLRLSGRAAVLETRLHQAQAERLAPLDLVATLVNDELQRRQDRLFARRHTQARLRDADRSLDGFDFTFNRKLDRALVFDLATARFIQQREDVLFLGPPGTGKNHLAQALGRAAIQQGYRVIYRECEQLIPDNARRHSVLEGLNKLCDLRLHPPELVLDSRQASSCRHSKSIRLACELFAELLEEILPQKPLLRRVKNARLNLTATDREAIGADTFVMCAEAREPISRLEHETASTHSAFCQAGKQISRSSRADDARGGSKYSPRCLLAAFDCRPQVVRNDAKLGHLFGDALCPWIESGHPTTSIRIFDVAQAIPHQPPDIKLVVQKPGATCCVSIDGARVPAGAEWSLNILAVQAFCDLLVRRSTNEVPEHAFNDGRFCWFNLAFACCQVGPVDSLTTR